MRHLSKADMLEKITTPVQPDEDGELGIWLTMFMTMCS